MRSQAAVIPVWGRYDTLDVTYDKENRTVWHRMQPMSRPCFSLQLLRDLRRFQRCVEQVAQMRPGREGGEFPVEYTVLCSGFPGVFNLGGDLGLFLQYIESEDRQGLSAYATACIDVLYPNAVSFGLPVTTVSLVQGDALGGGFEAAISSNVVIAEAGAKFGLPEVLFNLIPGMGAYSFLSRRLDVARAEKMILSGDVYSAEEMRDMGLVDVVAPDGCGEDAVIEYVCRHRRRQNTRQALQRVRECCRPVTYEELIEVTRIWVDAALSLGPKDLRVMRRLLRAQYRRTGADAEDPRGVERDRA